MQLKAGRTRYELLVNRSEEVGHTSVAYYKDGCDVGEFDVPSDLRDAKEGLLKLVDGIKGSSVQLSLKMAK